MVKSKSCYAAVAPSDELAFYLGAHSAERMRRARIGRRLPRRAVACALGCGQLRWPLLEVVAAG